MLIDVATFTSVALGPVAEAFGVHEISRYAVVQSWVATARDILPADRVDSGSVLLPVWLQATSPLTFPMAQPSPVIGPQPVTQSGGQVSGIRTLQQLALLSGPDISQYVAAHPAVVGTLLASPPPPRDVTQWWSSLDTYARIAVSSATPQLVGNLEGVPLKVRDAANRTTLHSTISELDHLVVSNAGRSVVDNAKQQLKMLQSISDALYGATTVGATDAAGMVANSSASDPTTRTLLTLDVVGQGRAAIVLGDLMTADYVTYLVPGMFFTIENQMGAWVEAADELNNQQLELLHHFDVKSGTTLAGKTVATVAWIGYHTPNLTNVGGIQNADEGRDALASAIKGLQSIRAAHEPYLTVIAHSYGSTAALMALTEYDFEVDALALVGSPGSPAKSVADLHVRHGNVFVGEGAWDPIPNSSYFGSDPGSASYGAKVMDVSGGIDAITGATLLASTGHNEYFSTGTESMRNFALISIGKGQFVPRSHPIVMAKAFGTSSEPRGRIAGG